MSILQRRTTTQPVVGGQIQLMPSFHRSGENRRAEFTGESVPRGKPLALNPGHYWLLGDCCGARVTSMEATDQKPDSEAFRRVPSGSQSQRQPRNKVVIQKVSSRLYLSKGDAWTPDIEEAKTFDTGRAALEETTHLKLQDFQLVPNSKPRE